jgi:hypothetical protein
MNSDCKDAAKPVCSGGDQPACVQCVHNQDCPMATPNCNNNVCGP